jgi:hypothetical protein
MVFLQGGFFRSNDSAQDTPGADYPEYLTPGGNDAPFADYALLRVYAQQPQQMHRLNLYRDAIDRVLGGEFQIPKLNVTSVLRRAFGLESRYPL